MADSLTITVWLQQLHAGDRSEAVERPVSSSWEFRRVNELSEKDVLNVLGIVQKEYKPGARPSCRSPALSKYAVVIVDAGGLPGIESGAGPDGRPHSSR